MTLPAAPSASSIEAAEAAEAVEVRVDDLVEDVSIDGMCGVY
ncbi:MAG: mycofactocin precursor MftA [Motilibacteraceae bacterium]